MVIIVLAGGAAQGAGFVVDPVVDEVFEVERLGVDEVELELRHAVQGAGLATTAMARNLFGARGPAPTGALLFLLGWLDHGSSLLVAPIGRGVFGFGLDG